MLSSHGDLDRIFTVDMMVNGWGVEWLINPALSLNTSVRLVSLSKVRYDHASDIAHTILEIMPQ